MNAPSNSDIVRTARARQPITIAGVKYVAEETDQDAYTARRDALFAAALVVMNGESRPLSEVTYIATQFEKYLRGEK